MNSATRRCRRHFRLQDVGLAREQHALRAKIRANLIGARLGRSDEAFVGDPPRPRGIGRESDCREDVEIVRLSGVKGLAVNDHIRELHARREERLALRPGVGLLGRALRLVGRIGEREDDRPLVEPAHRLDHPLVEGATLGADADQDRRLQRLDGLHQILGGLRLMCIDLLGIRQASAGRFQQPVDVEHGDAAARGVLRKPLFLHGGDDQIGDADRRPSPRRGTGCAARSTAHR